MGANRGRKKDKRAKLAWRNRKANRGRKPAMGKRKGMIAWREVVAKSKRNATKIIVPPKEERAGGE
ncbi:MAG: hypothetical protein D6731_06340 [Planctomycetota bacterium]|nr:MAG: hypothetical protein D6731_06340 [Planctomycetota bacterium]